MQKVTITTIDNICPFCGATRVEKLEKTKAIECYCCHAQARLDCLSRYEEYYIDDEEEYDDGRGDDDDCEYYCMHHAGFDCRDCERNR
mgnify:CR=1 FL=1